MKTYLLAGEGTSTMAQQVMVRKQALRALLDDFEDLVEDVELAESGSLQILQRRLQDVKEGRVKGLTERDLADYLRKRRGRGSRN